LGDSLIEKIRAGIDSVDFVIALLSQSSVASEWVKRELDIAMNQEIEGKRVKVLPILAEGCTLPGFLKGKLYADMSTASKFRKSLPLVLQRLNVSSSLLESFQQGKDINDATKTSKDTLDLLSKLESEDVRIQYQALKSVKPYEHRQIISHPRMIASVLRTDAAKKAG
jgi:TIR domain